MATEIIRIESGVRMSQTVSYGGIVILAGNVADDPVPDVRTQTVQVRAKIDR